MSSDADRDNETTPGASEGPVLLHIWQLLDPARRSDVLERLDTMLSASASEPGFVSARVLESNGGSIAVVLEMETAEDRQRLQHLPLVAETLRDLDAAMNLVFALYQQVSEYRA